jgi:hypothetical protein
VPAGAIAEARKGSRGGDGVVGERRFDGARLPLGAQFWRGVGELGRAARKILGEVEGGERRACVSKRHEFAPARLARARPPSLAALAKGAHPFASRLRRRGATNGRVSPLGRITDLHETPRPVP